MLSCFFVLDEVGGVGQAEEVAAHEVHVDAIEEFGDVKDLASTCRVDER